MKHVTLGFAVAVLVAVPAADEVSRGFYFGAELGVSAARPLESTPTNVGIATNCDQWLKPVVIGGEDGRALTALR